MPSRQLAWTEPSHENDVYTKPPEVPLPQRATGNAPVLSHHWHSSRCTLAVHSLLGNVVFSLYNQATRDRVPELVVPSVKDLSGPELWVRPVSLRLFIRHKETKERRRAPGSPPGESETQAIGTFTLGRGKCKGATSGPLLAS